MPKRVDKRGIIYNITLKTIHVGKENYPCIVRESSHPKYGEKQISYGCFKTNPLGTMSKGVGLTFTYHKPNNQSLAQEYTYEDLQNRAKRMLDSLYIKDGWDE